MENVFQNESDVINGWPFVFQDTVVGTQIMRVSATDVDEGDNQKITYDLVNYHCLIRRKSKFYQQQNVLAYFWFLFSHCLYLPQVATKVPADIEYFSWHYQTGIVTLKKKLDKPLGYMFVLKATASDSGKEPKTTEIDVTLEVKESDNKPPSFISGNYYSTFCIPYKL